MYFDHTFLKTPFTIYFDHVISIYLFSNLITEWLQSNQIQRSDEMEIFFADSSPRLPLKPSKLDCRMLIDNYASSHRSHIVGELHYWQVIISIWLERSLG